MLVTKMKGSRHPVSWRCAGGRCRKGDGILRQRISSSSSAGAKERGAQGAEAHVGDTALNRASHDCPLALGSQQQQPHWAPALPARCLAWVLWHRRELRFYPHHSQVLLRRRQLPRRLVAAQAHAGVQEHRSAVTVQHTTAGGRGRVGRWQRAGPLHSNVNSGAHELCASEPAHNEKRKSRAQA